MCQGTVKSYQKIFHKFILGKNEPSANFTELKCQNCNFVTHREVALSGSIASIHNAKQAPTIPIPAVTIWAFAASILKKNISITLNNPFF